MRLDLSGRVALVTGGSGQLGRCMVRTLALCGANVAIHCHKALKKAESLRREVEEMGREACVVQADLTREDEVRQMKDRLARDLAAPDIVVANAVIQYDWKTVLKQPAEDYLSQFESCVLQNVLLAQAFVPGMIARRWGRVVAISTECAMQNKPTQSAYVSGKRGMDGVLRCLAREVGEHGVTVNQVAPGWTLSEDRPAWKRPRSYLESVPLKRWGTDQEIANAVAFLASDLAAYITGAFLPVCGGNVMPAI